MQKIKFLAKALLVILAFILIAGLVITPAFLYFDNVGSGFSEGKENWSAFGSYIGGVYSAIFSFLSILVLSSTLYFTLKNNKEQIKLIKQEGTIKEFSLLMDNFLHHLSSDKKFPFKIRNEENFIHRLTDNTYNEMIKDDEINFDTALQKHFTETTEGLYEEEVKIILKLNTVILMLPDALQDTYMTILKTRISNDRRFILKKYIQYFKSDIEITMVNADNFCDMPDELRGLKNRMDSVY